ncbi:hypothetical protein GCM10022408_17670 [Hymenobacter fastidiosus]|uniref:Uncharacterized protein n=1 Tax=Hymenobacter fastidiosus TaxID=486264 RepID=A0ABP7S3Z5_9BACT
MKTKFLSLVLFLACAGCSGTEDPAPAAGVVAIRLTNTATWVGMPASACVRDTPLRAPGDGTVMWSAKMTSTTATMGPVARGKRLYLSIQYDDVSRPGYLYLLPARGEYIQADLLVDGKVVNSVFLNADSFNNSANYFLADATRMNLVQEVEVAF